MSVASGRDRALALAIPLLLALVAIVQIVRVERLDQSSWSGAGFGMFATIDNEANRTVRGYHVDGGTEVRLALPPSLQREAFELVVVPTEQRARALAASWRGAAGLEPDDVVAVEVWRLRFDGEETTIGVELLVRGEDRP